MINTPNYKKIYTDIIYYKYPEKLDRCRNILNKKQLTELDILKLNSYIYSEEHRQNQKHKSYHKTAILEILEYQKIHKMNNTQLAIHFKLSRNTVTKWKKLFDVNSI